MAQRYSPHGLHTPTLGAGWIIQGILFIQLGFPACLWSACLEPSIKLQGSQYLEQWTDLFMEEHPARRTLALQTAKSQGGWTSGVPCSGDQSSKCCENGFVL